MKQKYPNYDMMMEFKSNYSGNNNPMACSHMLVAPDIDLGDGNNNESNWDNVGEETGAWDEDNVEEEVDAWGDPLQNAEGW